MRSHQVINLDTHPTDLHPKKCCRCFAKLFLRIKPTDEGKTQLQCQSHGIEQMVLDAKVYLRFSIPRHTDGTQQFCKNDKDYKGKDKHIAQAFDMSPRLTNSISIPNSDKNSSGDSQTEHVDQVSGEGHNNSEISHAEEMYMVCKNHERDDNNK